MSNKKQAARPAKGLGRGLSSLLGDPALAASLSPDSLAGNTAQPGAAHSPGLTRLPVEKIEPGPWQPRRRFDSGSLQELAASLQKQGLVQPVLVRAHPDGSDRYQLIAGERRWRAAQLAKLHEIPAILRELGDREAAELALVENIQRTDLTAIEEAEAFQQLIDQHGYTQQALADLMGKSRPHIANLLRLLSLPEKLRTDILEGRLTSGQVRPLIGHPEAEKLAAHIIAKKLSARQAEALAKTGLNPKPARLGEEKSSDIRQLEKAAAEKLGVKMQLSWDQKAEKGTLKIAVSSLEQMDGILQKLGLSG